MPRPRMHSKAELFNAACAAVQHDAGIDHKRLRTHLKGAATSELLEALRAARYELRTDEGITRDMLDPDFAVFVTRQPDPSAAEVLNLAVAAPVLRERIEQSARAFIESTFALADHVRAAGLEQATKAEATTADVIATCQRHEQETLSAVDGLRAEAAEARAETASVREELNAQVAVLTRAVEDGKTVLHAADAARARAEKDRDEARADARAAASALHEEREHARAAALRHVELLGDSQRLVTEQAAQVARLEGEVSDLRTRLERAESAADTAAECATAARVSAAAADARAETLVSAHERELTRLRRQIEALEKQRAA